MSTISASSEGLIELMHKAAQQLDSETKALIDPVVSQMEVDVRTYYALGTDNSMLPDHWLLMLIQNINEAARYGNGAVNNDTAILQAIQDLKDRLNEIDAADQAAIARTTSEGPEQQQILISNFQLAMEGSLAEIRNDLEEKSVARQAEMTAKLAALEMNIGANGVGEDIRKLGQTMGQQINNMSSLTATSNATREKLANLDNMLAQMQAMHNDMKAALAEMKQVPVVAEKVVQETVNTMADVLNTKATELYRQGVSFTKSTTHDDPATLPGGVHPGLPAWVTNPMVKKVAIAVVVLLFIIIGIAIFSGGSNTPASTTTQTSSSLAPPATTTPSTPAS